MKQIVEIWKDIKGYEGYYQVSNQGNVKTIKDSINKLRAFGSLPSGYKQVTLCKDGKCKSFLVHRLVAEAFIPNPDNLPIINHKDEDKTNNIVSNLEWCTYQYNTQYSLGRKIAQIDIRTGKVICIWDSTRQIERELGFRHQNIVTCCNGTFSTAYKYRWEYVTNDK